MMDKVSSNITALPGRAPLPRRVKVLRAEPGGHEDLDGDASVFVTIGAAETHVSVLDEEARCSSRWLAIFGWSFLFGLPLAMDERTVLLEEAKVVERALQGRARIYGRDTDTSAWVEEAGRRLEAALDDILGQSIGSGAHFTAIVLCAPPWLHGLLSGCRNLRPHIVQEIREA